jgi:putative ABC transport system permease protein
MAGGERRGLRNALVVAEVAFSIVLLTGAGLLAKSFVRLAHVNPGFQPERVLAAGLTLPNTAYRTTPQAAQFYDALIERVRVLPGVRSAAVTDTLPLTGDDNRTSIKIPGYTPKPGERMRVHPRLVSAGYLETMGIPLEAGRTLTAADDVGTHAVAVISADMARLYWPNGDAVGKHFAVDIENTPSMEIVGIAGAVHNDALNRPVTVDVYLPYRENPFNGPPLSVTLVVRTERSEAALGPAIRAAAASLDRSLPVSAMRTMESYLSDSTAPERFNMALVALFAFLAAALAAAGLYGVLAYLVSRRTEEIGIRVALGARRADVLRLVMAQGIALAGVGAALGVAASFVGAELLSGLLFGVDPHDAGVFGTVPALLIAVAAVASYVPARRAAGVDPMVALRME